MPNRKAISPVPCDRADAEDMEEKLALAAFAALAHETRLAVFRPAGHGGPEREPAGEIAARLGVVGSTLSFHLKELDRAGLLRSWRRRRQIFYAADYEGTRSLLAFLTRDCCQGHPEICGDLVRLAAVPEPEEAEARWPIDPTRCSVHRQLGAEHHGRVRAEPLGQGRFRATRPAACPRARSTRRPCGCCGR